MPGFYAVAGFSTSMLLKPRMYGLLCNYVSLPLIDSGFFFARNKASMNVAKSVDALVHMKECK